MAASLCCPSILQPQDIKKQFAQAIFHISKSNQNQASHSSFTAHIKKFKATCKMCSNWAIKAEKKKRRLNIITGSVNFGIFDSNVCFIDFQHTLPTRYIKRKKNVTVKECYNSSVNSVATYLSLTQYSQPTFQRRINVVSTLWINVEITLIRRWKWNKIRRRIFNVAQLWYNVSARREATSKQRWYNVDTTLFQPSVDVS